MITDAILFLIYLVLFVVVKPITLLPDATIPADIASAVASAAPYLGAANVVLPVDVILAVVGAILTIEAAIFSYKLVMWLIRRLPTQS